MQTSERSINLITWLVFKYVAPRNPSILNLTYPHVPCSISVILVLTFFYATRAKSSPLSNLLKVLSIIAKPCGGDHKQTNGLEAALHASFHSVQVQLSTDQHIQLMTGQPQYSGPLLSCGSINAENTCPVPSWPVMHPCSTQSTKSVLVPGSPASTRLPSRLQALLEWPCTHSDASNLTWWVSWQLGCLHHKAVLCLL